MDFFYLVRRAVISEDTLVAIDEALLQFHHEREIFRTCGIRTNFNLPRQHSMIHYRRLIQMYGAPNGLCSSITENKHITAIKEPWRRSNRHQALGQMLLTNQRLDKLAAARIDYTARGMMEGPCLSTIRHQHEALDQGLHPTQPIPLVNPPQPVDTAIDHHEEHDAAAFEGQKSLGEVKLAKGYGTHFCYIPRNYVNVLFISFSP
jgi:hypothetical protein